MKRIDTHSHPRISKHFAFNPRSVARMVRMARRVGLDGVALTEHFHATPDHQRRLDGLWNLAIHSAAREGRQIIEKYCEDVTEALRQ